MKKRLNLVLKDKINLSLLDDNITTELVKRVVQNTSSLDKKSLEYIFLYSVEIYNELCESTKLLFLFGNKTDLLLELASTIKRLSLYTSNNLFPDTDEELREKNRQLMVFIEELDSLVSTIKLFYVQLGNTNDSFEELTEE